MSNYISDYAHDALSAFETSGVDASEIDAWVSEYVDQQGPCTGYTGWCADHQIEEARFGQNCRHQTGWRARLELEIAKCSKCAADKEQVKAAVKEEVKRHVV